jgi:hypothetical protein
MIPRQRRRSEAYRLSESARNLIAAPRPVNPESPAPGAFGRLISGNAGPRRSRRRLPRRKRAARRRPATLSPGRESRPLPECRFPPEASSVGFTTRAVRVVWDCSARPRERVAVGVCMAPKSLRKLSHALIDAAIDPAVWPALLNDSSTIAGAAGALLSGQMRPRSTPAQTFDSAPFGGHLPHPRRPTYCGDFSALRRRRRRWLRNSLRSPICAPPRRLFGSARRLRARS